jgi:sec-independent protein translocase protein TatB
MFGLSWGQIAIVVIVGIFVLGPERIPTAVTWVLGTLRKVKTMAAGAQEGLRSEIGPEIEELRRQVADLQSLKEIQGLRELRDLSPKKLLTKNLLGDEFAGGLGGFLGLNNRAAAASSTGDGVTAALATDAANSGADATSPEPLAEPATSPTELVTVGAGPVDVEAHRAMLTKSFSAIASQVQVTTAAVPELVVAGARDNGTRLLVSGDRPPFDIDGT